MTAAKTNILIVEDELAISELVAFAVKSVGWNLTSISNANEAWDFLQRQIPDLVILDWMLPGQSGIKLLSRIRESRTLKNLPIIMLTAKSTEEDKLEGLNTGADDYMTKPFSPRELTARINALLRRKLPEHALNVMRRGIIELDPSNRSVSINKKKIDIGNAEFNLLKFLMAHPDRVFSRDQLLDKVWGNYVEIEERTVDVHILRLRKALGEAEHLIKTVRGAGYAFAEKEA